MSRARTSLIEARYAEDNFDRLPELARELVRLDVDLLFVSGDQGVKAAKQAADTIPSSSCRLRSARKPRGQHRATRR